MLNCKHSILVKSISRKLMVDDLQMCEFDVNIMLSTFTPIIHNISFLHLFRKCFLPARWNFLFVRVPFPSHFFFEFKILRRFTSIFPSYLHLLAMSKSILFKSLKVATIRTSWSFVPKSMGFHSQLTSQMWFFCLFQRAHCSPIHLALHPSNDSE